MQALSWPCELNRASPNLLKVVDLIFRFLLFRSYQLTSSRLIVLEDIASIPHASIEIQISSMIREITTGAFAHMGEIELVF